MSDLILPVKGIYFEQILSGEKLEEYRLDNAYWQKRLLGKFQDRVIVTLGYPSRDDHERRIVRPYKGWVRKTITHPHFGPEPVAVFAIWVGA